MPDIPRLVRSGDAPEIGIVHLGPGAFFRAFNGVFTDEAMVNAGGDWGILAVSLRSATARDQLDPQGGVYTSVTLSKDGMLPQQIVAIARSLVAPEDPTAVVLAMSDPQVKIVSLTITEKGYCHAPMSGALDVTHPDIVHDLDHPQTPKSAVGFIVAALAARREAATAAFTVLPCDNIPSNGALTRRIVLDFARRVDRPLAEWIDHHVFFPSTMVDRITPATTQDDIAALTELTGHRDEACVFHEGFRQWVIEDRFTDGRPAWDTAGAQFVSSVEAHELMKLRCLNGTHSLLAYLGFLAGYDTIAETIADPHFAKMCKTVWRSEVIPTVPQPDGEDLHAYCDTLLTRYQDPSIRHRTWQIAMDGSQKLPQRFLGTISDLLAVGRDPFGLALGVAAWMRYVSGIDEQGQPIDVRDPLADVLRKAHENAKTNTQKVDAILAIREIFSHDLACNTVFRGLVLDAFDTLMTHGARAAVKTAYPV